MATQIFMQTKDLEITRSVLLHSSIMTSQIYLSYEPEKVENALQQIVAIPS
jgi:site-specific recombinase XerD